jgi:hypothetical protein
MYYKVHIASRLVKIGFMQIHLINCSLMHSRPLLYGSLGVELGEQFAKAFGPEQGLYWADGTLMQKLDPKVQESRDLVSNPLRSFWAPI